MSSGSQRVSRGLGGASKGKRVHASPSRSVHSREFRPSLMVEAWVVLMLYGGGVMSDLSLLDRRGVRRIFGWVRVPNPTTFGRWLRRAAERMVPLLDAMLWHMVRRRRALSGGAPKGLTLVADSTVVVRYGKKQAGAGAAPTRPPGRRSGSRNSRGA